MLKLAIDVCFEMTSDRLTLRPSRYGRPNLFTFFLGHPVENLYEEEFLTRSSLSSKAKRGESTPF